MEAGAATLDASGSATPEAGAVVDASAVDVKDAGLAVVKDAGARIRDAGVGFVDLIDQKHDRLICVRLQGVQQRSPEQEPAREQLALIDAPLGGA